MNNRRYIRNADGSYYRYTLAFMTYLSLMPKHKEHGANHGCRRAGNKPLPPRNYEVYPIFERVGKPK